MTGAAQVRRTGIGAALYRLAEETAAGAMTALPPQPVTKNMYEISRSAFNGPVNKRLCNCTQFNAASS